MTFIQRVFKAVLPRAWAEDMEVESRKWILQCSCGYEQSIWDIGGIRWRAVGRPRRLRKCPQCGRVSWQPVVYRHSP